MTISTLQILHALRRNRGHTQLYTSSLWSPEIGRDAVRPAALVFLWVHRKPAADFARPWASLRPRAGALSLAPGWRFVLRLSDTNRTLPYYTSSGVGANHWNLSNCFVEPKPHWTVRSERKNSCTSNTRPTPGAFTTARSCHAYPRCWPALAGRKTKGARRREYESPILRRGATESNPSCVCEGLRRRSDPIGIQWADGLVNGGGAIPSMLDTGSF
nr:hypothetical protein Iba_chr13eCG10350 [Ipomoea batatas]